MSLLSDLLSKVKYPNPGKEVPPGLKSTVSALKKKESNKRLLAVVTILAVVLVGAGFATVYLIEIYIKGGARQSGLQKNIAIEQRKQQTQSQPTLDIKPYQEPLTERQKKPSEIAKARQPEKKSEKKDIQYKKRGTVEPKKKSPQKKSVLEVVQDPKFKNLDEAEKKMETEKTAEDTSEKDLYLHLAKGYEAKRDYSKALDSYKKILRIEPKNYRVMNNIASILIQQGSNEEAKVYLRMAIEIKKDYVPGLINMGIVLAKLGDVREAESYLLQSLTLEPDNRHAIFNIALLYEKEGNYEKAREYYLRLKQLGDARGVLGLDRIGAK